MTYPAKMRELAKSLRECEWNHPIDAAATCENVAAELERLERIEAALPKTADGVTITRGMIIWRASEANESYEVSGMRLYDDGEWWLSFRDCRGWGFLAETCYGTLEAAKKASGV